MKRKEGVPGLTWAVWSSRIEFYGSLAVIVALICVGAWALMWLFIAAGLAIAEMVG